MRDYTTSNEAKAKRRERVALYNAQRRDQLAERQRLIAFWRKCAETNKAYLPHNGCWWWVFTWNVCFRDLLMPKLRGRQDARDRAHQERYAAELRESARQWQLKKAEHAAAKRRTGQPQRDLVDEVAA
jgi:hypothetical protein